MSICVDVQTQRRIRPEEIFDSLVEKGMNIVVTNYEFPCLKFGMVQYSVRGIEVYEEDNGYEIRVCVGSSEYDYRCFCQTIHIVSALTNGTVFTEDNEHIDNIGEFFDDTWIEHQMRDDCSLQRSFMNSISVELIFNFTVDYNEHPIVTIEQLKETIPDFDWSRTFGNYKLKINQAKSLETLFAPYFDNMKGKADGTTINATHYLS